jgi:hypothetical protein
LGNEVAFCPFCGCATAEAPVAEPVAADTATSAAQTHVEPPPPAVPAKGASFAASEAKAETNAKPAKLGGRAVGKPPEPTTPPQRSRKEEAVKPQVQVSPPSPSQSSSKKLRNFVVLAVAAIGTYTFINHGPSQSAKECESAVEQAATSLKNGDLTAARMEASRGGLACGGEQNADKLAVILQTIDQQEAEIQRKCNVATRPIAAMLSGHRLTSASSALDRLSPACAEMDVTTELRHQLGRATTMAAAVSEQIKTALAEGNADSARRLIGDLEKADTENSLLPQWRAAVVRLEAAQTPAFAPPNSAPATELRTSPYMHQAPSMANSRPANVPPQSSQNEMARQFLSDAESALAQKRFDAARTFAESARRLDPNNPRVRALTRAIQERERQVLQEETTIN